MSRYKKSQELLASALKLIPLGSQTFSKSMTQFPLGVSPHFIERGKGSHVWDIDGNEYIDFINGLMSVLLGYKDNDVDRAVKKQMENGVSFSLSHELEVEVAGNLTRIIPCAEMVRFGKNGSDVTAGAIRLARAYTNKEHVAVCGYHGWQDWYIGSTSRNLGVPKSTQLLTHRFAYNDISSLEKLFVEYSDQIAAVILEPMYLQFPENNFLENVKDVAHAHGAVLIFDEIITGFRFSNGGAQEYFKVVPDIATFGKGMGNGYPISAIVGKKEIMELMNEIFFSFTYGGETISLAATNAVLKKIQEQPVVKKLAEDGSYIYNNVKSLLETHGLSEVIEIAGHPACSVLVFQNHGVYSAWDIKTFFMQEMLSRGILTFGTHNMSYAHTKKDCVSLLEKYDEVFSLLKFAIQSNSVHERLNCNVLKPLFAVR